MPRSVHALTPGRRSVSETGDRLAMIVGADRANHLIELGTFLRERAGYRVLHFTDGRTALAAAQESRPAIVITEVLVPELDGLSLCRRIRSDPALAGVRILAISNLSARDRALETGADAFLMPPWRGDHLIAAVKELLDEEVS